MVPSDAKLLEAVSQKPQNMTKENWNFLCSLRFGLVVFSAPLGEMASLPYQVGEGDLDGDLVRQHCLLSLLLYWYVFTCLTFDSYHGTYDTLSIKQYLCVFGKKILKSLDESANSPAKQELRVRLEPSSSAAKNKKQEASTETPPTEPPSSSWLSVAQDTLLNLTLAATSSALTGKLYSQCNKKIDEKSFAHRDARLLSRAYKDSLDGKKHKIAIGLPSHLRDEIPTTLRGLVELNNSPSATDNGDDDYDGTEAEDGSNCGADAESDRFDDSGADGLESCSSMDTDSEEYYY